MPAAQTQSSPAWAPTQHPWFHQPAQQEKMQTFTKSCAAHKNPAVWPVNEGVLDERWVDCRFCEK